MPKETECCHSQTLWFAIPLSHPILICPHLALGAITRSARNREICTNSPQWAYASLHKPKKQPCHWHYQEWKTSSLFRQHSALSVTCWAELSWAGLGRRLKQQEAGPPQVSHYMKVTQGNSTRKINYTSIALGWMMLKSRVRSRDPPDRLAEEG